jgi:alcohol dehydrogenase class IV
VPYFLSPKVIFGRDALKRLGPELEGKGKRAFVITDKNLLKSSRKVSDVLVDAGYQVRAWDGAEPDPSTEVAIAGGQFLSEFAPDWVIGFGGGSAIDTAKAAWVLYERPDLAAGDLSKAVLPKTILDLRRKARFVAVPTTSGTGADVTWVAVLTHVGLNRKIIFAHHDIVPDLSVLDPELTGGMPREVAASTGIDVLGHAVDGYTSRQQSDFSDGLCLQAMKLAFEWLPRAYEDEEDPLAREKMQNAATIAGLGFGNSNTGLSHALAHSVGTLFHIPHGRAVGIALPYSLEYICSTPPLPKAPDPVDRLATAARFIGVQGASPDEAARGLIQEIRQLIRAVGEPRTLREVGVTDAEMKEAMEALVQLGGSDPNMFTTPCACDQEELRQLFLKMWEGDRSVSQTR